MGFRCYIMCCQENQVRRMLRENHVSSYFKFSVSTVNGAFDEALGTDA